MSHHTTTIRWKKWPDFKTGRSDALVGLLQTFNTPWNRPVWLTEFSTGE